MKRRGQYIAFEGLVPWSAYARYTHSPSGATCLKGPHVSHQMWLKQKLEFLAQYPPHLRVVEHDSGKHLCDVGSIIHNITRDLRT